MPLSKEDIEQIIEVLNNSALSDKEELAKRKLELYLQDIEASEEFNNKRLAIRKEFEDLVKE